MHKARVFFASAFAASLTMACSTGVVASDPETIADGVYTEEQAARGQPLYQEHCANCHDMGFYAQSLGNRVNQPVAWMFEEILGTMPMTAPGSLPDQTYEDIFAYILSGLGFPAGDQELTYGSGGMQDIRLVTPE